MTFVVQVALSTGAGVGSEYLRLDDPVAGQLDVGLLAPEDLFTDFSTDANGMQRVMAFTIDRGSTQGAGALVEYATGTLSLTLRDDAGDLDPASIDEAIPGARITLSKLWGGDAYPLFTGTIDSWLPEHRYPDQAVLVVTASDMLASLAGTNRGELAVAVGSGDDAGARLERILDSVSWPAGQRDIDTGIAVLTETTLSGSALDEARETARAEVGDLWATPAGLIRFRSRYAPYLDTAATTVQATFGSGGGSELPFVGTLGVSYDRSSLINVVKARRDDDLATVYEVGDTVSRSRYGDRAHEQLDLPFATDDEVTGWAGYVIGRDAIPKLRFTSLEVDVRADEDALYPQVLTREFGDRIEVVRRPPGVAPDTREVHIRGIQHTFQAPTAWTTTWELETAGTVDPFFLDDVVQGQLDANSLI
jgi:hypothetical protein